MIHVQLGLPSRLVDGGGEGEEVISYWPILPALLKLLTVTGSVKSHILTWFENLPIIIGAANRKIFKKEKCH